MGRANHAAAHHRRGGDRLQRRTHHRRRLQHRLLAQEPQLDDTKTVREIVEEGAQEVVDALEEFDDINMRFGEQMTDDEMTASWSTRARCRTGWTP